MISVPSTYSEWIKVITLLKEKKDDENVLKVMQQGTIEWQTGVAERFAKKLIEAVNYRMNLASDRFQKNLMNARGQESAIVNALLGLRKEMMFLSQVVNIPVLPEKERQHYVQLVISQANSMQSSLEDSAKTDRKGKLASIVRNHKVNSF